MRYYIVKCLNEREDRLFISQCHTLNLAFCYELGFGISRDIIKYRSLLYKHNIPIEDLEHKVEQAKRITQPQEFQNGIFRKFLEQGHFNAFNFSQQYREEQRSLEAESRYRREVETIGSILGDNHRLVQELRRQLSLLMAGEGRWKDAEKLQVRMIELDKRVTNEGLTSNLAETYRNQGRWEEAEQLEVQVMETYKRVLGAEHPNTLISIANLASTYRDQGRWKEVEQLEISVMETRTRVLGVEHPDTLISIANLASTYRIKDDGKRLNK